LVGLLLRAAGLQAAGLQAAGLQAAALPWVQVLLLVPGWPSGLVLALGSVLGSGLVWRWLLVLGSVWA
jgi:hypothetical protein